ncbi:uncharacterized protein LOC108909627 [Anoplophora glabripennis]|uniref:uncharacterized protein LOC108909627 n=1 Tax=Anoplophora glabripennis TaxID=217634 RepID=UPI000874F74F|nr:uncharacterized protein LOC108909627 [Anoplophora glabripennis]
MAHSLQGVYSPLPQSLSDSDSEKEISMEPICTNYVNSGLKHTKLEHSSGQNGHLDFHSIDDDVLKVKRVNPKMSTLRKAAFIFSILLCFFPIIIFLWILPCSNSNTCPVSISNWEYQQDNIELRGKINLVHGAFQNSLNLAMMYKGSFNSQKMLKHGVISFMGSNGAIAWDFQQGNCPIDMNCSIIDVDGNGFNDCLVTDEKGLKVIETVSGEAVWHANSDQEKSIPKLDMPVKVDDFDNDGTNELLSIYKKKSFLLISGKTGRALSNIKLSRSCTYISNLTLVSSAIRYGCEIEQQPSKIFEISFSDLKNKYHNANEQLSPKEVTEATQVIYETGNHKLTIENYGSCPHCQSTISLYGSNNTKLNVSIYANAYVMAPLPYSFQSTEDNMVSLKGHIHGFILKIWQWRNHFKKLPPTARIFKRSLPIYNKTYYLNEISEIVVLITFNETDRHIINASLTDRYQICMEPDDLNSCEPDHEDERDSLLIADMDHDNSLELISYSSSYIKRPDEGSDNWHLVSFVKVLRLENELRKLYE